MVMDASFGAWLRRRRKALDLTQEALAERVGCSPATIRKIEGDERRPSRQIAEILAEVLAIATGDRAQFLRIARGELRVERLTAAPAVPLAPVPEPGQVTAMASPPATLPARAALPLPPTSLIGREAELAISWRWRR
jgi:transcriptional regulator with XRE-family HTH domain